MCVWPLAQRTVGRGKSARGARGGDRAHHLLQRPEARAGACVAGRQNPIPETDGLLISGVDRQLSDKLLGCWRDANGDNRPPGITRRPVLSQVEPRFLGAPRRQTGKRCPAAPLPVDARRRSTSRRSRGRATAMSTRTGKRSVAAVMKSIATGLEKAKKTRDGDEDEEEKPKKKKVKKEKKTSEQRMPCR